MDKKLITTPSMEKYEALQLYIEGDKFHGDM